MATRGGYGVGQKRERENGRRGLLEKVNVKSQQLYPEFTNFPSCFLATGRIKRLLHSSSYLPWLLLLIIHKFRPNSLKLACLYFFPLAHSSTFTYLTNNDHRYVMLAHGQQNPTNPPLVPQRSRIIVLENLFSLVMN